MPTSAHGALHAPALARRRPGSSTRCAAWLLVLACGLLAACQGDAGEPASAAPGARLVPDPDRLSADVAWLAAAERRGRRAGTPGNAQAAARVDAAFDVAGLEPLPGRLDHRLPAGARLWRWGAPPALALGGVAVALGRDFEPLEWAAAGAASAPLAFAGYGLELPAFEPAAFPGCPVPSGWNDLGALDLTGRVAVVVSGFPGGAAPAPGACPTRSGCGGAGEPACHGAADKAALAIARGAAAVLFVPRSAVAPPPRPFAAVATDRPALWVTHAALAAALADLPERIATVDRLVPSPALLDVESILSTSGAGEAAQVESVIGVIPGADPVLRNEVVVVGAHFDHLGQLPFRDGWYPGADDNASGTAVLLELARLWAAAPAPPARTLVFAAWNGEELGLIGSRSWVGAPPFALAATVAAFSLDMVGVGGPGLQVAGADPSARALFLAAEVSAASLGLEGPVLWLDEPVTSSDHAPFAAAGVPAAWLSTPTPASHPNYHTAGDTADLVRTGLLVEATRLAWAAIAPWAEGMAAPPRPASRAAAAPSAPLPHPHLAPSTP